MRITAIHYKTLAISGYAEGMPSPSALDTTMVAINTDRMGGREALTGYGFTSIGRFGQAGLMAERFAPRLLNAEPDALMHEDGAAIDPKRAWSVMMTGEKPGGHGERCVAVGALDMALWDLAAKAREMPLCRLLAQEFSTGDPLVRVPVYAGGGYYFPDNELWHLRAETERFRALGFTASKIKIGGRPIKEDMKRIDAVLDVWQDANCLAVDAMNSYSAEQALAAARALKGFGLRWFEDICDPLDFETHKTVAGAYDPAISAGEAIFSLADARNLLRYAGLRPRHDVLTFDPAHCYGISEFARIVELFKSHGWSRADFQPHGGHLYSLHVAAGLGLGGCECNPHNFQPFGGFSDGTAVSGGQALVPDGPGIGFELRGALMDLFKTLVQV